MEHLPDAFRIERFLGRVEGALIRASLNEHSSCTEAAAAVCVPFERFVDRLGQHDLEVPRDARPESVSGERILWCSDRSPPPGVREACDEDGVGIRAVPPGTLHPASVLSAATIAAVVEPVDEASAIDVWVLDRSVRPFVLAGEVPAQVALLFEELGVQGCATSRGPDLPAPLLRAARCAANLFHDEQHGIRLPYRPDCLPAWPLDVPALLLRLEGPLLRLAKRTTDSSEAAARAVGLSERTFRRHLRAADLRDAGH